MSVLSNHEDFAPWDALLKHVLNDYKIEKYITESVPESPLIYYPGTMDYTPESIKALDLWKSHRRFALQLMLQSTLSVRNTLPGAV